MGLEFLKGNSFQEAQSLRRHQLSELLNRLIQRQTNWNCLNLRSLRLNNQLSKFLY